MNKNYIIIVAVLVIIVIFGIIFAMSVQKEKTETKSNTINTPIENTINNTNNQPQEELKEFKINSFYEIVDGKAKSQFSLKEIIVKKGDIIKIEVTNTKGMHDFVIDEYKISQETPLNVPTTIQFKADKVGEFIYYCSKPGHRAGGQWGTLKVVE
jgi:heme/copper-type cytochrome/quinol oxidase subunit 2